MSTYNQVCSFGPFCHTGNLLQKLKIKIASFPFDWLCTTPLIISDCIENNFRFFLDKSYYILDETTKHPIHKYYAENFQFDKMMFAHSNPLENDVYEYLKRCIKRFEILLKSEDKKLFVISYMVTYTEKVDSDYLSNIKTLNETLSKHTTNYDILCIVNTPNQKMQSFHLDKTENNIFILQLSTYSISHGVFFLDERDNEYLVNTINDHFVFDIKNIYGGGDDC